MIRRVLKIFALFFLVGQLKAQVLPKIEWVKVPSGTFIIGSPNNEAGRWQDEKQHKEIISSFSISKYEITFEQYDQFCEATGRKKPSDNGFGRGKNPVINVNWNDAKEFAEWIGCRLPTEAEWEYACRAGKENVYQTGSLIGTDAANYNGRKNYVGNIKGGVYRQMILPVGSFEPNGYGLHDMHGNVWEWCSDVYVKHRYSQSGYLKKKKYGFRVIKGGGWESDATSLRCANRGYFNRYGRYTYIGFRVACDAKEENEVLLYPRKYDLTH